MTKNEMKKAVLLAVEKDTLDDKVAHEICQRVAKVLAKHEGKKFTKRLLKPLTEEFSEFTLLRIILILGCLLARNSNAAQSAEASKCIEVELGRLKQVFITDTSARPVHLGCREKKELTRALTSNNFVYFL